MEMFSFLNSNLKTKNIEQLLQSPCMRIGTSFNWALFPLIGGDQLIDLSVETILASL